MKIAARSIVATLSLGMLGTSAASAEIFYSFNSVTATTSGSSDYIMVTLGSLTPSCIEVSTFPIGGTIKFTLSYNSTGGGINVIYSCAHLPATCWYVLCDASNYATLFSVDEAIDTSATSSSSVSLLLTSDAGVQSGAWDSNNSSVTGYLALYNTENDYTAWIEIKVDESSNSVTILGCAVDTDGTFVVGAVPEPAESAAILGLAVCAVGILRRRRK
jgi:hypothetical protein